MYIDIDKIYVGIESDSYTSFFMPPTLEKYGGHVKIKEKYFVCKYETCKLIVLITPNSCPDRPLCGRMGIILINSAGHLLDRMI